MLVTVFTPSYNRAYILPKLYESLKKQTVKDFEWLIVDDGSTDDTERIVRSWLTEPLFPIRYIKQQNGGKHIAINHGALEAKGELFFIVDSDDQLTEDAIEWVSGEYNSIGENESFCGLAGIRISPDGRKIGDSNNFGVLDCTYQDFRIKHKIQGDMAEVMKTKVMREFPFVEIPGEKFCPEALVWRRMGEKYKTHYVHHGIYICEYIEDGLTANITRVRRNSPLTSMLYYSEYGHSELPFLQKLKGHINYWRFTPVRYYSKIFKFRMFSILSILSYIPGLLMRLNDKRKI